jgi:hypothetical protein
MFGSEPNRPPYQKEKAQQLVKELKEEVKQLSELLYKPDDLEVTQKIRHDEQSSKERSVKGGLQVKVVSASGQASDKTTNSQGQEIETRFVDSKTDFLRRHIMDYQNLFKKMSVLSGDDSFLFFLNGFNTPPLCGVIVLGHE